MDPCDDQSLRLAFYEQTLSSETVFSGRVFTAEKRSVLLPDGRTSSRELIHHSGGAAIVALDDQERVVLVRQYRISYDDIIWEIPAGKLEEGEDPLLAAQRELQEETGYRAKRWQKLAEVYPTPGYCDERIHIYLARDLVAGEAQPDEGEFLEKTSLSLADALPPHLQKGRCDSGRHWLVAHVYHFKGKTRL